MTTKSPKCPVCGRRYDEHPAISRYASGLNICSECGTREAIDGFFWKWHYRLIMFPETRTQKDDI